MIKRIEGVSTVNEYGPEYSMRILVKPDRMAQLGVTSTDIANAIDAQSVQLPTGRIGQLLSVPEQKFQYSMQVQSQMTDPEE